MAIIAAEVMAQSRFPNPDRSTSTMIFLTPLCRQHLAGPGTKGAEFCSIPYPVLPTTPGGVVITRERGMVLWHDVMVWCYGMV